MPPLKYDTKADTTRPAYIDPAEGDYGFEVKEALETRFQSGNDGIELTLIVRLPDRDLEMRYEKIVFTPRAMWRVKQFMDCLGLDFKNPPDAHHLVGCSGRAHFVKGKEKEKNGKKVRYLEVGEYLPREPGAGPSKPPAPPPDDDYGPPPMDDDDLPF